MEIKRLDPPAIDRTVSFYSAAIIPHLKKCIFYETVKLALSRRQTLLIEQMSLFCKITETVKDL